MNENAATSISVSLLNRKIYSVCYPSVDTLAAFHGALFSARRSYYETGKTVRVHELGIYNGLSGETVGKISRRTLKWKKRTADHILETFFSERKQHGIEFREPGNILRCRIYLDREHHWVRSEYFAENDPLRAKVSFKPDPTSDTVLRFDYNYTTGKTKETILYPVPYAYQTAEQSYQNAKFGEDLFLVSTDTGEFAYCPKKEQQERLHFLEESRDASVMLSMGWEVRDGDILSADATASETEEAPAVQLPAESTPPRAEREPEYIFESIEQTVRLEQEEETEELLDELLTESRSEVAESAQESPEEITEEEPAETPEETAQPEQTVVQENIVSDVTLIRAGQPMHYIGTVENGKRDGFGRTQSAEGFTVYEGEYKNDLRDGFGTHHYRSGAVSYIGDFKEDKRDGFGVSFRENDHSLHVSRWADGKPEGYAALFDPNGTMKFAGKIIEGQKQGAGVSIDPENDTVFIAKYENNEMTGEGALFAGDGTLLYMGGWKDVKREGHGTEFDRNGDVVYAGEWKNDRYENGILYKKVQGDPENGSH